jgi:hypothetical protein
VSTDEAPVVIDAGFAPIVTVGPTTAVVTVTTAVAVAEAPAPVAVAVYVVVAVGETVFVPPEAPRAKLLPSVPVTVTCVALVAATVSVEVPPAVMETGFALMVTVAAGGAPTVTIVAAVDVPPTPVAVAVYVAVDVGVMVFVPPVAPSVKLVPSVPVTEILDALVAAILRTAEAPAVIEFGVAEIETVGGGAWLPSTLAFEPQPVRATIRGKQHKRNPAVKPLTRRAILSEGEGFTLTPDASAVSKLAMTR